MPGRTTYLVLWSLVFSCGGSPEKHRASPTQIADENTVETPGGREVVAMVENRPVYASCVVAHAKATGASPRQALEACVQFEVSAQAARRFANHPEVRAVQKKAAVRAFVEREFWPEVDEPGDIKESWLRKVAWSKPEIRAEFQHGEFRAWGHALAPVDKESSPEEKVMARQVVSNLVQHFRGRKNLAYETFALEAKQVAGDQELVVQKSAHKSQGEFREGTVEPFSRTLFAMKTPGTTRGVVETKFGFHVILLLRISPAVHKSFAEALPVMREKAFRLTFWRFEAFHAWANQFVAQAQIKMPRGRAGRQQIDAALRRIAVDEGGIALHEISAAEAQEVRR